MINFQLEILTLAETNSQEEVEREIFGDLGGRRGVPARLWTGNREELFFSSKLKRNVKVEVRSFVEWCCGPRTDDSNPSSPKNLQPPPPQKKKKTNSKQNQM